jgi:hypothetical protein
MVEAYSHELSSAGFWPGMGLGTPAFYSYAYPQPAGFAEAAIEPREAYYHAALGEFILPYEAAAQLGGWDRTALEREPP